jgi:hypothetical protein
MFVEHATSQPDARRGNVPRILACVPGRLERELAGALGPGVRATRSLELRRIGEALRVGEYVAVVTDPSVVSPAFLDRLNVRFLVRTV